MLFVSKNLEVTLGCGGTIAKRLRGLINQHVSTDSREQKNVHDIGIKTVGSSIAHGPTDNRLEARSEGCCRLSIGDSGLLARLTEGVMEDSEFRSCLGSPGRLRLAASPS